MENDDDDDDDDLDHNTDDEEDSLARLQAHVGGLADVVDWLVRHVVDVPQSLLRLHGHRHVLVGTRVADVHHPGETRFK